MPWWRNVGMGMLSLGFAVGFWLYLGYLENAPGEHSIHWLIAIPYNLGGKPAATALFWVLGLAMIAVGARKRWKAG